MQKKRLILIYLILYFFNYFKWYLFLEKLNLKFFKIATNFFLFMIKKGNFFRRISIKILDLFELNENKHNSIDKIYLQFILF